MVTRNNHVRDLAGDVSHPLLPEVPVGFIQHTHITATRASLVRDFSSGKRGLVLVRDRTSSGKSRAGAVIAHGPVVSAGKDTGVPVIRVTDVTPVPRESSSLRDSLENFTMGAMRVGVAHIVEHSNAEWSPITSGPSRREAQHFGLCGTIGTGDLIVVRGIRLQMLEGDLVEELAALGDRLDCRTGGCPVVPGSSISIVIVS
jgi:hypothetical protein